MLGAHSRVFGVKTPSPGNLGYDTFAVPDATATFDKRDMQGKLHPAEEVHAMSLANLQGEYATIVTTAEVLRNVATGTGPR
jgi:hypothetical protein